MPSEPKMTPGQALRLLDRPAAEFPGALPWESLDPARQRSYEQRAAVALNLAFWITSLVVDGQPDPDPKPARAPPGG